MSSYPYRTQARDAAWLAGVTSFRTIRNRETGEWEWFPKPGFSPAEDWAQGKDFVSHVEVEVDHLAEETQRVGIVVVTITKEELANEEIPEEFIVEPIVDELFDHNGVSIKKRKNYNKPAAGRGTSSVASPTKLVWEIADSMPDATRKEVVAACVERGVHKSTASTQYYRWAKVKNAK